MVLDAFSELRTAFVFSVLTHGRLRQCFRTGQEQSVFVQNSAPGAPSARQEARPPKELPLRDKKRRDRYKREGEAPAEPLKWKRVFVSLSVYAQVNSSST